MYLLYSLTLKKHTLRYSPTGRKGLSLIFRRKRFSPSTELLDVVAAVPGAKSGGPWLVLMLDIVVKGCWS